MGEHDNTWAILGTYFQANSEKPNIFWNVHMAVKKQWLWIRWRQMTQNAQSQRQDVRPIGHHKPLLEHVSDKFVVSRSNMSGWWFGCHFLNFPINIGNVIIPIDFHIFRRGGPTTNQMLLEETWKMVMKHVISGTRSFQQYASYYSYRPLSSPVRMSQLIVSDNKLIYGMITPFTSIYIHL